MKILHIILFIWTSSAVLGQNIKTLEPTIGAKLDFSPESIARYNSPESWRKCEEVWKNLDKEGRSYKEITSDEKEILRHCDEAKENIWMTEGSGCSWYCGMGPMGVTASSYLASQGNNSYRPENAHDFSYKNAWVEGVNGYGIGEYLEYHFAPESPRVNKIVVINGYVKSKSAWENNSRVKLLKMYVDDKPFAYLYLKDIRAVQSFSVPPIGNGDRNDLEALKKKDSWKIKFEIADVYKGLKYDDVVITEISFDGLDVHCLARGTKITLANGQTRNIEWLSVGDEILSYNLENNLFEPSVIKELASPVHDNLMKIIFKDGSAIIATADHPFYDGNGWRSFDPQKTSLEYRFDHVRKLQLGDRLQTVSGWVEITAIKHLNNSQQTYTIVKLEKNNAFIANDLITGTETLREPGFKRSHAFNTKKNP